MELTVCNSITHKRKLLKFYKSQYLNHPLKRDSLSGLLKGVLFNKSVMNKSIELLPLYITENNEIIMSCVLAKASRMPNSIQISFFESKEKNKKAFKMIYDKAMETASLWKTSEIIASLNIHVNYGLGFLSDSYDKPQSFGMAHNDDYIHEYFEDVGFEKIPMVTFYKDMSDDFHIINDQLRERIKKRYTVRPASFKELKQESSLYTFINNDAFRSHRFYYPRVEEEDFELFRDFKHLLKPENLLFVEKKGKAVGFMLWYPDFHQIMNPNETVGLKTVIKNKIIGHQIDRFKIVEMGVIEKEQKRGAILALFDYCFSVTKDRYNYFESGWILKENFDSANFGYKWSDGISKIYTAYVKNIIE